ncbi:hypothetical protein [Streptomyces bluensis]|uniref:Uncharacterized protein n=1 Tax=Streptomyces bluensis TaxID=33897 RepID=A0ABW6UT83_9ACTN
MLARTPLFSLKGLVISQMSKVELYTAIRRDGTATVAAPERYGAAQLSAERRAWSAGPGGCGVCITVVTLVSQQA